MSKAMVVSAPGPFTVGAEYSVAQIELPPGSYVVMVKLIAIGMNLKASLYAGSFETVHWGDTGITQEIPVGEPVVDKAEFSEQVVITTLSAIVGVTVHPHGRAECICDGDAKVENVMMVAIEVDDLTVVNLPGTGATQPPSP